MKLLGERTAFKFSNKTEIKVHLSALFIFIADCCVWEQIHWARAIEKKIGINTMNVYCIACAWGAKQLHK